MSDRPEDVRMSLGEHVEELRRRLLRAIYAFVVSIGSQKVFKDPVLE